MSYLFCFSSSRVLCTQSCQCLWIVHFFVIAPSVFSKVYLPSDKTFVIIIESEYCSILGEHCEFTPQLLVLTSKLALQHACCIAQFIAQCTMDDTVSIAMFVECPITRFSCSILKVCPFISDEFTFPKQRNNNRCWIMYLKYIVQYLILQWQRLFICIGIMRMAYIDLFKGKAIVKRYQLIIC